MPHRDRGRQRRPVEDLASRQDGRPLGECLAGDAHIRAECRGDADFHGVRGLGDARRVIRVLDLDDGVRTRGDRRPRHDAPRASRLQVVVPRVARRNVASDGQRPRPLAPQVVSAHGETIHRRVREGRKGSQGGQVERQATPEALIGGQHLGGQDMAEREGLDQLAVLGG